MKDLLESLKAKATEAINEYAKNLDKIDRADVHSIEHVNMLDLKNLPDEAISLVSGEEIAITAEGNIHFWEKIKEGAKRTNAKVFRAYGMKVKFEAGEFVITDIGNFIASDR